MSESWTARRMLRRGLAATGATLLALGATAGAAAAHVTVQPGEAEQGGYAAIAFRVPNEREDASTTTIQVTFPEAQPLASARVKPRPGWTYEVVRRTLDQPVESHGRQIGEAVQSITWTAASPETAIKPGEFDDFLVSLGPLPEAERMVFKTAQTYSSGEVVSWDQEAAEGAEEPERPAPVLTLTPADDDDHASAAAAADSDDEDDDAALATGLAAGALVVALIAAVLAGLALRRRA